MTYRLLFEPKLPATPWALEDETGERRYFRAVEIAGGAHTEIAPGPNRLHGYLVVRGMLAAEAGLARVGG